MKWLRVAGRTPSHARKWRQIGILNSTDAPTLWLRRPGQRAGLRETASSWDRG